MQHEIVLRADLRKRWPPLFAAVGDELAELFLARIAADRGSFESALNRISKAPSLLKTDLQAQLLAAEIYMRTGGKAKAAQILAGIGRFGGGLDGMTRHAPQANVDLPSARLESVNEREAKVARKYETDGWRVLRGGAPDFLMIKVEGGKPAIRMEDGKIRGVKAVEVKSATDPLSYEQSVYRMILEAIGVEYVVEVEK